jgi:hypothetical protein
MKLHLTSGGVTNASIRTSTSVLAVTSLAGFALWVVDFQVLACALGWPWFPDAPNAVVQIVAHTVFFGTVLGIGFIRLRAIPARD